MQAIKIYGERNTGTRYIDELLRLNFHVAAPGMANSSSLVLLRGVVPPSIRRLQEALPGRHFVRDMYFVLDRGSYGWKHSVPRPPSNAPAYFITVTKNPYSWLLSFYRRPYLRFHPAPDEASFESFLETPWQTFGRDNLRRATLPSPVDLWNIKNRAYLDLADRQRYVLTTTYEQIVSDPWAFVDAICGKFEIESAGRFVNANRSTKDAGRTFADYVDYYLNERWREQLTTHSVELINGRVDEELMRAFGYHLLVPQQ